MRKIFTFIIFGFVLSHLTAQPLSNSGSGTWISDNNQSSNNSHSYTQFTAPDNQESASIAKNNTLSVTEGSGDMPLIRIYPNPVNGQLQLIANERIVGNTIRVYNLIGSEMISRNIESGQEVIDVSSLQVGLYLFGLIDKNNKTVLTGKFNKQ